jgi:hypothetical protein
MLIEHETQKFTLSGDRLQARPPPPPSRTDWTRLVPPPVLNGHAASLLPYARPLSPLSSATPIAPRTPPLPSATPPPPRPLFVDFRLLDPDRGTTRLTPSD